VTTLRLCLAIFILCSLAAFAQDTEVTAKPLTDQDIKMLRQDVQTAKDQIISDTMQFSTTEKAAFWPVYKDYAAEQHAIADKRLKLITDYAQNLDSLDDAKAKGMTERMFQIEDDTQELRKKYYSRFVQALGAKRAALFYQVDNRLTLLTNMQLASAIPLIP
jgi:Spy/CpxP family protein refolding chaperone